MSRYLINYSILTYFRQLPEDNHQLDMSQRTRILLASLVTEIQKPMLSKCSSTKLLSAYTFSDFSSPPLQHNFHHVFTSQASKPIPAITPCFQGNTISSWQNTWLCHHPQQLRPALPRHRPPEPHAADAAGGRPLRSLPPARRLRRPRPPPSIPPILPLPTNTQDYASYAVASFGVLAG